MAKIINFEKTTIHLSHLTPKRILSTSQSSCSDKFANFPYLPSKAAVEKELGVYMSSYSHQLKPAKKCLNFIADLRGRTFDIWMELEEPEAHHQVNTVYYPWETLKGELEED